MPEKERLPTDRRPPESYVWFETDNWEQWEEKLVFGPYIHHVGGMYGSYARALEEAARYLNVTYDTPGKNQIKGL